MKKYLFLMLASVLIISMALVSCPTDVKPGNIKKPGTDPKLLVLGISELSEGAWDYLVIGNDGSSFYYSVDESNDTQIPTKVYYKPKKDSDAGFTIFFKENGLPDIMEYNGSITHFANFNGYTFDMAVIYPNGEIEYQYGIETDIGFDDLYSERSVSRYAISAGRSIGGRAATDEEPTTLDKVSKGLDVAGHAIGIGTCYAGLFFPPALVGCAFYLGGTAVGMWADILLEESGWQDEAGFLVNYAGWAIDVVQCVGGLDLIDCISAGIGAASIIVDGVRLYMDDEKIADLIEEAVRELFVSVRDITNVPATAAEGIPLTLTGTVQPSNASYWLISWSMVSGPATINGRTLTATATGDVTVKATIANGTAPDIAFTRNFTITVIPFVAVTDITDVPTEAVIGKSLALTGTVQPVNASSQAISWSVVSGPADILSRSLYATAAGPVIVRATIPYGTNKDTAFTKDFTITVGSFVAVTGITGVPATGTVGAPLTLTATVEPANASFQTISWNVVSENPYSTISGNTLTAYAAGTVAVRAIISNGAALGSYTQIFYITFGDGSGNPTVWTLADNAFHDRLSNNYVLSIAYGGGRFVAVGDDGQITYSLDGVTWTAATTSYNNLTINCVAYGGGRFVAGGDFAYASAMPARTFLAYSSDGVIWTTVDVSGEFTNPRSGRVGGITSIAYDGNGRFVAGAHYGQIAYSSDGITWTAVADSTFDEYSYTLHIAYGGGRFVAGTGVNAATIAYSTDGGVTWTAVADRPFGTGDPHTSGMNGIAYGNGRFVAVGDKGQMAYSANGAAWTAVDSTVWDYPDPAYTSKCTPQGITYGGGKFVAVGDEGCIAYSSDGIEWTASAMGDANGRWWNWMTTIAYGGGRFAAGGDLGLIVYCIPD